MAWSRPGCGNSVGSLLLAPQLARLSEPCLQCARALVCYDQGKLRQHRVIFQPAKYTRGTPRIHGCVGAPHNRSFQLSRLRCGTIESLPCCRRGRVHDRWFHEQLLSRCRRRVGEGGIGVSTSAYTTFLSVALCFLTISCVCSSEGTTSKVSQEEFFRERVAPILQRRCLSCHNHAQRKGDGPTNRSSPQLHLARRTPGYVRQWISSSSNRSSNRD